MYISISSEYWGYCAKIIGPFATSEERSLWHADFDEQSGEIDSDDQSKLRYSITDIESLPSGSLRRNYTLYKVSEITAQEIVEKILGAAWGS